MVTFSRKSGRYICVCLWLLFQLRKYYSQSCRPNYATASPAIFVLPSRRGIRWYLTLNFSYIGCVSDLSAFLFVIVVSWICDDSNGKDVVHACSRSNRTSQHLLIDLPRWSDSSWVLSLLSYISSRRRIILLNFQYTRSGSYCLCFPWWTCTCLDSLWQLVVGFVVIRTDR